MVWWFGSIYDSCILENFNVCVKFECWEINGILLGDNGYFLRLYFIMLVFMLNIREKKI